MARSGVVLGVLAAAALLNACGGGGSHPPVAAGVSTTDGTASTAGLSTTAGLTTTTGAPTTTAPPAGAPGVAPSVTATGGGALAPPTTAPPAPPRGTPAPTTGTPPPPPTAPPSLPATTTTRPPASAALAIRNFSFQPATLRVAPGTVVTVTNDDATTHTWTADGGGWDSGPIAPASSYRRTFTTPGTFTYHCSIHTYMTGTVQVA